MNFSKYVTVTNYGLIDYVIKEVNNELIFQLLN